MFEDRIGLFGGSVECQKTNLVNIITQRSTSTSKLSSSVLIRHLFSFSSNFVCHESIILPALSQIKIKNKN